MNKTWSAASVVGRALANRPESSPLGSELRRSVAGDGFGIVGSRERGSGAYRGNPVDVMPSTFSNMVKGETRRGLFVPAGPSHLPCAGWEDRQTLTSFVQSDPHLGLSCCGPM